LYRCDVCGLVSSPGQGRLLHVTYRPNGSVARERPVCAKCKAGLEAGRSDAEVRRGRRLPVPRSDTRRVDDLLGVPLPLGRPAKKVSL